jgi:chemotaxis response regulator CheB
MGFLTSWFRSAKPLLQLHSGSFSMDRTGRILATTLPSSFPRNLVQTIGQCVALTFEEAQNAQLPLKNSSFIIPGSRSPPVKCAAGPSYFLSTPNSAEPTHKTS